MLTRFLARLVVVHARERYARALAVRLNAWSARHRTWNGEKISAFRLQHCTIRASTISNGRARLLDLLACRVLNTVYCAIQALLKHGAPKHEPFCQQTPRYNPLTCQEGGVSHLSEHQPQRQRWRWQHCGAIQDLTECTRKLRILHGVW